VVVVVVVYVLSLETFERLVVHIRAILLSP